MQSKYFFAFLFISSGIFYLLNSLDIYYFDFEFAEEYWAITLIFIVLSIIIGNKIIQAIIMSLLGIYTSMIIFCLLSSFDFNW